MKLKAILFAMLLPTTLHAQGIRWDSNIFTAASNVPVGAQAPMYTSPYAKIMVCSYPASGAPCINPVNIYNDQALTMPMTQPIVADAFGRFGFWIPPGMYAYTVQSANGINDPHGQYIVNVSSGGGVASSSIPQTLGYYPAAGSTIAPANQLLVNTSQSGMNTALATAFSQGGAVLNVALPGGFTNTHNVAVSFPNISRLSKGGTVNPEDFGAYGDYAEITCSTIAASASVTCTGVTFDSTSVGKTIFIGGAGSKGYINWLDTTIVSVSSTSSVTLSAAAANTVTSAWSAYGHDDNAALQACINASSSLGVDCRLTGKSYLFDTSSLVLKTYSAITGKGIASSQLVCGPSVVNANYQPNPTSRDCVAIAPGPIQFNIHQGWALAGVEHWAAPPTTYTLAQQGFHFDAEPAVANGTGGLMNSTFQDILVYRFWGRELWVDGYVNTSPVCGAAQCPNQFINFLNCQFNRAFGTSSTVTTLDSPLIYANGQNDQFTYVGGQINGSQFNGNDPRLIYLNGATGWNFYGDTLQLGVQGIYLDGNGSAGAADIVWHTGWVEAVQKLLTINSSFNRNTGFDHTHIASSCFDKNGDGLGYCAEANVGTHFFMTELDFAAAPRSGTAPMDRFVLNFSGTQASVDTSGSLAPGPTGYAEGPFVTVSSGFTRQMSTATTLNSGDVKTNFVNGDGGAIPIGNLATTLSVGDTVTYEVNGGVSIAFTTGGNINFGTRGTPLSVLAGGKITLRKFDTIAEYQIIACEGCSSPAVSGTVQISDAAVLPLGSHLSAIVTVSATPVTTTDITNTLAPGTVFTLTPWVQASPNFMTLSGSNFLFPDGSTSMNFYGGCTATLQVVTSPLSEEFLVVGNSCQPLGTYSGTVTLNGSGTATVTLPGQWNSAPTCMTSETVTGATTAPSVVGAVVTNQGRCVFTGTASHVLSYTASRTTN